MVITSFAYIKVCDLIPTHLPSQQMLKHGKGELVACRTVLNTIQVKVVWPCAACGCLGGVRLPSLLVAMVICWTDLPTGPWKTLESYITLLSPTISPLTTSMHLREALERRDTITVRRTLAREINLLNFPFTDTRCWPCWLTPLLDLWNFIGWLEPRDLARPPNLRSTGVPLRGLCIQLCWGYRSNRAVWLSPCLRYVALVVIALQINRHML